MSSEIIIFLRQPVLGQVKTRLALEVGEQRALKIYRTLIDITLQACREVEVAKSLYFFPRIDQQILATVGEDFTAYLQDGPDLGAKMSNAFAEALDRHGTAVIVGTDCPYITPELLDQALRSLEEFDVVLGPASDGGYYLLGMKRHHPSIFVDVDWSTEMVLQQTLVRVKRLNLSYHLLPELSDVDYHQDWQRYCAQHKSSP